MKIFNTTCVAGAFLQKKRFNRLGKQVTDLFIKNIFKTPSLPTRNSKGPGNFTECPPLPHPTLKPDF